MRWRDDDKDEGVVALTPDEPLDVDEELLWFSSDQPVTRMPMPTIWWPKLHRRWPKSVVAG